LFIRLSAVCAVVFFAFVARTMTCAVAEGVSLTAEERSEVIASLKAYQANFARQRVRIEIAGREIWGPPKGRLQPINIGLELSGSQIYANIPLEKQVTSPGQEKQQRRQKTSSSSSFSMALPMTELKSTLRREAEYFKQKNRSLPCDCNTGLAIACSMQSDTSITVLL